MSRTQQLSSEAWGPETYLLAFFMLLLTLGFLEGSSPSSHTQNLTGIPDISTRFANSEVGAVIYYNLGQCEDKKIIIKYFSQLGFWIVHEILQPRIFFKDPMDNFENRNTQILKIVLL